MPSGSSAVVARDAEAGVSSLPRLLYVASTKSQGGIERHSVDLAAALAERGGFVRFACCPGGFVEQWCREISLPTIPIRVRNSGDLRAALGLARIVCAERIDIVHVHSRRDYVVAVLGVALAKRLGNHRSALILHAHMIRLLGSLPRLSGRFFEWGADAVAAVSGAVCDLLRSEHRFHPAFVHLVPNGIPLDKFARSGSPEAFRRRAEVRRDLGISDHALVLGMIGRLDAKGQRQLLDVVPRLIAFCPGLRIVLVGSEGRVGEQAALTALSEAGGFAERLVFTGPRSDIPYLLTAFDVLVHLPIDEAFGLALAEAMAAGLPTVATGIGGCREVVQDGVTGSLVPPGDPEALFLALADLLNPGHGPSRRAEMGIAGYHSANAELSQEIQVERLLALYHEVSPVVRS